VTDGTLAEVDTTSAEAASARHIMRNILFTRVLLLRLILSVES